MTRVAVFIFIGFLAVSQGFGEDLVSKIQKELAEAEEWIENDSSVAKTSYRGAMNEIKNLKSDVAQKVERLKGLYDRALDVVESSPKECQNDLKKNLMILKAGGVGNFFTCSKLLEAGKDVFEIGVISVDLLVDVIDIGRDMALGFSNCFASLWPWRIVECWYDRITTTYDDIRKIMSDVQNFASNISTYAQNASALIEYCWDGSSAEGDVVSLMTPLHQCAKQPVPRHIYKL